MINTREEKIEKGLTDLLAAIQDSGSHPVAHREIVRRHREEWPTLWRAIDDLLNARTMAR